MPLSDIAIAAASAAMSASRKGVDDFIPRMSSYTRTKGELALLRSKSRYQPHHGKNISYRTDANGNIRRLNQKNTRAFAGWSQV